MQRLDIHCESLKSKRRSLKIGYHGLKISRNCLKSSLEIQQFSIKRLQTKWWNFKIFSSRLSKPYVLGGGGGGDAQVGLFRWGGGV